MKTRNFFWFVIGIVILAAGYFWYVKPTIDAKKRSYTFVSLEHGDIESSVTSTGKLEAINTLQVGTQISGTIRKIYADYNDTVRAGQLLAEIDVRLLDAALANARASFSIADTRLAQADEEYTRNRALFEGKVITEKELNDSKFTYQQALGSKKAAEAGVRTAGVNLAYARITSPIAGVVTGRSIEEGQTVAASFATPTLFIIAEDLAKMQILADVDESDIGYIQKGMPVRFVVQTYPDKKFYGTVSQIRLEPVAINNVVNYKVVVDVDNAKGFLLPGMTANLEFITEVARDVMILNNAALRFRPDVTMSKEIRPIVRKKAEALPDSVRRAFVASLENEGALSTGGFRKALPAKLGAIFFQVRGKQVDFAFVNLGITTGLRSQIVSVVGGNALPEGATIIGGVNEEKK
ncbi:efflux RND transporter periplasmic adaptor subunit [Parachryseolinea silvisoli]|uniref:efflux RND transporter periplasmic adaptor subunit n=1 Tax=Parachryseolinea silvisoli TaxID=2873601 RepID=UPI002265BF13|nr:efflux RND transporter periplasmic adaptor subunit [Parachryseolinea silvisoli]MCD9015143.1 efflux RND transporter periplasmic adaptor subunit [Parachryseolinea silvisoli]